MRGRETSLLEGTETGEWRERGRERGREGGGERERDKGFSATKVTVDLVLVFGCHSRHK